MIKIYSTKLFLYFVKKIKMENNKNTNSQLATLITVFFFWGFVAASNGVLIPNLKNHFTLSQFQSQMVDYAFYFAYFVGSLIYFLWSTFISDPINKIGMKNGLVVGLLISAVGAFMFVPAVNLDNYIFLLLGLFIIAFGFTLLQIVANPFVINLGNPSKGAHRLSLAGSINSLGTTLGPVVFSVALYGTANQSVINTSSLGIESLKMPFIILGIVFILLAVFLGYSNLPSLKNEEVQEKKIMAFKYPQLVWGMLAIFVYVGVEVTIQSNMGALLALPNIKGIDHTMVGKYISLYWGSLMIGRWTGALNVFDLKKQTKTILGIVVPFAAFAFVLFFNTLSGNDVQDLFKYIPFIILFVAINFWVKDKPATTLIIFGSVAAVLMLVGIFSSGDIALYSFMSGGLFCSVMWPCIFNLAIAGLGKYTTQASSLLIMMILGGAIIPPMQGLICDMQNNPNISNSLPINAVQLSYGVAVLCFAFLAWYGYKVKNVLKSQGINYETSSTGH